MDKRGQSVSCLYRTRHSGFGKVP